MNTVKQINNFLVVLESRNITASLLLESWATVGDDQSWSADQKEKCSASSLARCSSSCSPHRLLYQRNLEQLLIQESRIICLENFQILPPNHLHTLRGSFSAVSTPRSTSVFCTIGKTCNVFVCCLEISKTHVRLLSLRNDLFWNTNHEHTAMFDQWIT